MLVLAVFEPNRNTLEDIDTVKKITGPAGFYFSQDRKTSSQEIADAAAGTFSQ